MVHSPQCLGNFSCLCIQGTLLEVLVVVMCDFEVKIEVDSVQGKCLTNVYLSVQIPYF